MIVEDEGRYMLAVLLDDDQDLLDVLNDILKEHGYLCKQTRTIKEFMELGDQIHHASVVVLDVSLQSNKDSGIDAYRWLKDQKYTGRVCFLTGYTYDHPTVASLLSLKSVDVVTKPLSLEKFMKKVIRGVST